MNILFVTEKLPFPLDTGGNVRSYHLLRGLAQQHRVVLLSAADSPVPDEFVKHLREFCSDVVIVEVGPGSWLRDLIALAGSIWRQTPFILERHRRTALADSVASLCIGKAGNASAVCGPIHCVYFNHLDAAIYMKGVPEGTRLILDQHNVVTKQVRTALAEETNLIRKRVLACDQGRLERFEVGTVNAMDCCLVCSQTDADALVAMGARVAPRVIPNGVDTDFFGMSVRPASSKPKLVFVGTLDYDPCERGVWFFCTEILPLLKVQLPLLQFVAVGRNPSRRIRKLAADDPSIVVTGRVPDVRPHMQDASVFVVPLRSGSGTRLKILEAMASGIPIVSTSIGAEGLQVVNGKHLWLADKPAEFAELVARILRNADEAELMRQEARLLVEASYSWTAIHRDLQSAVTGIA